MKPDIKLMTNCPETKEECLQALQCEDKLITRCLQGIFKCRLEQGDELLEAYEKALLTTLPEMEMISRGT